MRRNKNVQGLPRPTFILNAELAGKSRKHRQYDELYAE